MEKEYYIIKMEILNMKVILLMISLQGMEDIFIKMVIIIQENGKMVQRMGEVIFIIKMEI